MWHITSHHYVLNDHRPLYRPPPPPKWVNETNDNLIYKHQQNRKLFLTTNVLGKALLCILQTIKQILPTSTSSRQAASRFRQGSWPLPSSPGNVLTTLPRGKANVTGAHRHSSNRIKWPSFKLHCSLFHFEWIIIAISYQQAPGPFSTSCGY